MSHHIDRTTKRSGSAFYTREPAWHGLGHVFEKPPTIEEALEQAGLDWNVEAFKLPQRRNRIGEFEDLPGQYVTRLDTDKVLGIVGPDWTPVQNRDQFLMMRPLLEAGAMELEAGGSLREGKDVWLLGRFAFEKLEPEARDIMEQMGLKTYLLLVNNHAGTRRFTIQLTAVRVVCANTQAMAEDNRKSGAEQAVMAKHTKNVRSNVLAGVEALTLGISKGFTGVAKEYDLLRKRILTVEEFSSIVEDTVAPLPKEGKDGRISAGRIGTRMSQRNTLRRLWTEGTGHTGDHSAWEALQGTIEALDHHSDEFVLRKIGTEDKQRENRILRFATEKRDLQKMLVAVAKK